MMTGRSRVMPAASAASWEFLPSFRWSFAKVIIRMLLDVATPMLMIAPMSDGTLIVVAVRKSIHRIPASAPAKPSG